MHFSKREEKFIDEFRTLCDKYKLLLHPAQDGGFDFNDITTYHPEVEIVIGEFPYVPHRFTLYLVPKENK